MKTKQAFENLIAKYFSMMLIHHLINSRSQRIIWLLEELHLEYQIVFHERDPETRIGGTSLKAAHPLGKVPLLCDGDILLAETQAIVDYLIETYDSGKLAPAIKTPERIHYLYWKSFAEGTLMPLLALAQLLSRTEQRVPWPVRFLVQRLFNKIRKFYLYPQLKNAQHAIESHLKKHTYLSGNHFSGADILLEFMLAALAVNTENSNQYPATKKWLESISERQKYQTAKNKGKWDSIYFRSYWSCLGK